MQCDMTLRLFSTCLSLMGFKDKKGGKENIPFPPGDHSEKGPIKNMFWSEHTFLAATLMCLQFSSWNINVQETGEKFLTSMTNRQDPEVEHDSIIDRNKWK